MYRLSVPEMNCEACVGRITRLLHAADPAAQLSFDLPARELVVASTLDLTELITRLDEGGYQAAISPAQP